MDQVKTKKFCFRYFSRFVTSTLTLILRITYSYVLQASFPSINFLSQFQWVLETRKNLILFYVKESEVFCVNVYQFAAQQQMNTLKLTITFFRFQIEECVLRVNKSKITGENTFNGDPFQIGDNHGSSKDKKFSFGYFCRFVTSALTLRPPNTYIYVFQALFGFCNFKATSSESWKLRVSSFYSILNYA